MNTHDLIGTLDYEHPGFPADSLPAIPEDWKPSHWHNDTCPSWHVAGSTEIEPFAQVFIEHPDPDQREMAGCRFLLANNYGEELTDTDDWTALLSAVAAVQAEMGPPRN